MMKKTLFAMLAVALMSGQVFGAQEFKVSQSSSAGITTGMDDNPDVDANITIDTNNAVSTINIKGNTILFFEESDILNVGMSAMFDNDVNITYSEKVGQLWIDALTAENAKTTIMSAGEYIDFSLFKAGFGDIKVGENLTLTGTTDKLIATYKGFYDVDYQGTPTLNDGDIALLWEGSSAASGQTLSLVGKGLKVVPEPATATLSLLALAGLATRRKRK